MKEYLKMSKHFTGDVTIDCNGNICDDKSYFGNTDIAEDYYEHVCHAINSHDELVSKFDVAESTIYEVERVLSEMQRNGAYGLDDVIAEVGCCIKRLSQ